jgi:glycosyltransferase involved in cell wall biosynthesis
LVSHNLNLEGSTLGIFNIGKSLRSSGYLVAVVSPCDGKLRDAYLKNGIPVLIMPDFGRLASIGNEDLRTFMASFDVIFANTILMYFVVPFVRAFRFRANPRIVWMIRESPNLDEFCREVGTTTQMLQYAFANADRVVFLCKATRDLFTQFDKVGNFAVIHDSVDWDDYTDLSRKSSFHFDGNAFNVLTVGTIYPDKGQDVLVDAALDLLTRTDCNFKFHFVGKIGHEEFYQTLRKKIDRHGMGGRIVFLGELSRRDVVRAYSECSAFVLPSRRESFPTVVLEAMAAGKPIIATKVFGTVEQVVDNHSALLVEPNDKSSLADALLRIYSDSALATRLGDNARKEFLERFTLKTMAGKFQELVEELTPEPLSSLARMH